MDEQLPEILTKNKVELPDNYLAKYITPSEMRKIISGSYKIKGSCVEYKYIEVPKPKIEKLKAVCADHAGKFWAEAGIVQYQFPASEDTHLAACTEDLKPNWKYPPFTGNGFLPTKNGTIVPYWYLTQPVNPGPGHMMILFDEPGAMVTKYTYNPNKPSWDFERDRIPIEKEKWIKLVQKAKELAGTDGFKLMWEFLLLMNYWYGITRADPEKGTVRPFAVVHEGTPSLPIFTSQQIAIEFGQERFEKENDRWALVEYPIPESLPRLMRMSGEGIQKIVFNFHLPKDTFFGDISTLMQIYAHHLQTDPLFRNDLRAEKTNRSV